MGLDTNFINLLTFLNHNYIIQFVILYITLHTLARLVLEREEGKWSKFPGPHMI